MNKVSLIIKREYLTRVRKKTFILSTFLFPIIIILFVVGSVFIAVRSREVVKIAIPNDSFLRSNLKSDSSSVLFVYDPAVNQNNFQQLGYTAYLKPNRDTNNSRDYSIVSRKQIGLESMEYIRHQLNQAFENRLLQQSGIDKETLDSVSKVSNDAISVTNKVLDETGKEKEANAGLAYGIGFTSGILIYITMFIFGAMVMRGVMEEKMNRIAEVIISSVKPFQLMMGKIIGIAAVGLTQFLMWIILIIVLMNVMQFFVPHEALQQLQNTQPNMPGGNSMSGQLPSTIAHIIGNVNWLLIISCFLFYFLGGYLFYAALFAAVGSVVNEDPQEAQSLMLPITMPIIFAFLILSTTISHPNSPLAFWGSMIPFTSPIVMMGRIAYGVPEGVPWWQLFLSMGLLVLGFIFTTWFAGKIYRTGILMYGKRASWKEMIKWLRRSS